MSLLVVSWLTILIGAYLLWTGAHAILYFREQERLMGRNWVLHSFLGICWTTTIAAAVLLGLRLASTWFAPPLLTELDPIRAWGEVLRGIFVLWLLLIPDRLHRLFKKHEGR